MTLKQNHYHDAMSLHHVHIFSELAGLSLHWLSRLHKDILRQC